ncbi:hypothetical protein ACNS7O_02890 [Haloferacaceae archaeon DSL9]
MSSDCVCESRTVVSRAIPWARLAKLLLAALVSGLTALRLLGLL